MKGVEVMTARAATIRPHASLAGHLDAEGTPSGIVSVRDFLRCRPATLDRYCPVWKMRRSPPMTNERCGRRVGEVISKEPMFIRHRTPVEEIVELMERYGVERLTHGRQGSWHR